MFRSATALSLVLIAGVATAQDRPATPPPAGARVADSVPPPGPPPAPTPAEINARVNAVLPPDQAAMKAHVLFLASDAMRGREAGSPEFDIAAQYVAAQFYAAGLRPGGDDSGYLQRVPLVTYKLDGDATAGWTPRGGTAQPLVVGTDWQPSANPGRTETTVTAPVVFVGYGIDAAQFGQDDYKGVDVRGRIVAVVQGAPARFGGEERAFFASVGTKAAIAERHGAIGIVTVSTRPAAATPPGAVPRPPRNRAERMTWAKPDGAGRSDAPGAPSLGSLTAAGAAKLFGADWAKVMAVTGDNPRYPTLRSAGTLTVATRTAFTPGASSNVIGVIPGTDPALKHEVVVLSAHLDHIGVNATGEGDRINNGALDNALGIASLIEEAKRFTASGTPPKRTIMFLAVTGEEKGLVGSDWFANHPTVPLADIVADVNLDMPILTYRFEDMIVYGADRTTLGPVVRRAVESAGVGMSPDPMPEQGIFVRSDHFRFVQKGIPAVFLWPGQKGPGAAAVAAFMGRCYHRPCDELAQQPIMWDQGVRFVDVNYRIAREVADGAARPVWNRGDYFGMLYKGRMAR
ncbi:M28 family metallopeptidase [Sphingomonas sp.]|uniref:M28 family metallopeptidase n=1 Tax=Sphingomonas sp. TaxID=28214 RepID=UPI003AFF8DD5